MKELSTKEILDYCIVAGESPLSPKGVIAYKELILNRLEEAEKTIEDMKCCGNCKKYGTIKCPKMIKKTIIDCESILIIPKVYPNNGCCDNWQSDNLAEEERK